MATFSQLPEYLRQSGRAFSATPDGDLLQMRYQDAAVSVTIAMRRMRTAAGSEWIALGIPLGQTSQFKLRAALVANDDLPIGALADHQGLMLLHQTLPLRSLTFDQLEQALRALAHIGASIVAGVDHQYLVR